MLCFDKLTGEHNIKRTGLLMFSSPKGSKVVSTGKMYREFKSASLKV